jgi:predicted nucleotidyltransferase
MVPPLPPDFRDFLQFLNEEKVEYLLIGGWAVAYHGAPRYTADIDVWVAMDADNARRIIKALERFGFTHGEVSEADFLRDGAIIRMGMIPSRIEIMNRISGVEFRQCYEKRLDVEIEGLRIPVISLEDLLTNKRSSRRGKDIIDVEHLTG